MLIQTIYVEVDKDQSESALKLRDSILGTDVHVLMKIVQLCRIRTLMQPRKHQYHSKDIYVLRETVECL